MSRRGRKITVAIALFVVINTLFVSGRIGIIEKWYFYAALIAMHAVIFTGIGVKIYNTKKHKK